MVKYNQNFHNKSHQKCKFSCLQSFYCERRVQEVNLRAKPSEALKRSSTCRVCCGISPTHGSGSHTSGRPAKRSHICEIRTHLQRKEKLCRRTTDVVSASCQGEKLQTPEEQRDQLQAAASWSFISLIRGEDRCVLSVRLCVRPLLSLTVEDIMRFSLRHLYLFLSWTL